MRLSFLKKLFIKNIPQDGLHLFDNAPFLAPWYFSEGKPMLIRNGQKMKWKAIDKINDEHISLTTLQDMSGDIFGYVKIYNYIHPSEDKTKFLIWNRVTKDQSANSIVTINLYDISGFTQVAKSNDAILDFYNSKRFFYFPGKPTATMKYLIEPTKKDQRFAFPDEFKIFALFLIVAECEGLYNDSEGLGSTIILELNPKTDTIKCYPQDWFNKSNVDLGYQWITRAIRDSNGFIHGQGIRISDFILNENGTELKK